MKLSRFVAFVFLALTVPFGLAQATVLDSALSDSTSTNSHSPFSITEGHALNLRETAGRLVVKTIEDALRTGGLALLGEGFKIDSSLSYVSEQSTDFKFRGEVDLVIPFYNENGHVVFTQPGVVFWQGLAEEERVDANFGIVYRTNLENTPIGIDAIGGASLFYDYDLHRVGHERLGIGADIQTDNFHGALNYYHPLSNEEDGREGFIEEALKGVDLRVALERSEVRAGARIGLWRFDGGEDVADEWRTSVGFDAGYRVFPGVFIEGDWEKHQEDLVLEQRFKLGLAFRFSLPDFEGRSYAGGSMSTDLHKIVDREKRILYEEREAVPPVRFAEPTDENGQPLASTTIEEGSTVTIAGELEVLSEPVVLELVINEDATRADLGDDFNYGHKVYALDASTGRQSAPSTATNCPATTCAMTIPAGVTRFDVEIEILDDDSTDSKELPEEIVLRVDVPVERQHEIRGGEMTRVVIRGHGNTVVFAEAESMLGENGGTVDVAVNADLASPVPIRLNVSATSTNAVQDRDYTISSGSLTIPGNADGEVASASLRLTGIDNDRSEGNKTIELTLSGSLPEGWTFGTRSTHTVTLLDDELSVGFAAPGAGDTFNPVRIFEENPEHDTQHGVTVRIESTSAAPSGGFDLAWEVMSGEGDDQVASTSGNIDFSVGDEYKEFTLMINKDSTPEGATPVTVRLDTPTSLPAGWEFGVQEYTFTIEPGDAATVLASTDPVTANEGDTLTFEVRIDSTIVDAPSTGLGITVGFIEEVGEDIRFETNTVIPAGQNRHSFTVEIVDDDDAEGAETYTMFISVGEPFPNGFGVVSASGPAITINPSDAPTASLNFSGSTTIAGTGATTRMRIDLSEKLTREVRVTLVAGGTATYANAGNQTYSLGYTVIPEDGMPAARYNFQAGQACTSVDITSTGCVITIPAGRTIVDLGIAPEGLPSGETIMLTLGIDSMSSNHVVLGTSSTQTLTVQ